MSDLMNYLLRHNPMANTAIFIENAFAMNTDFYSYIQMNSANIY